jgi:hypothetical protein
MRIATLARTAAIQAVIFLGGLVAIELALRLFFPLPPHGGEYRDASGNAVRIARDTATLEPRLDVRHIASEYFARIRTDDFGYRRMSRESTAPDFLFLGDSFTFGHGVSDEEVASEVFCKARGAACLNLGRSGTNTFDQVRLLRHALDENRLRPKNVVLTMLAACWLGIAGNDLGDNLTAYRSAKRSDRTAPHRPIPFVRASLAPSLSDAMRTLQGWLSGFEITKRVLIVASSGLKRSVYACSQPAELDAAANATSMALGELALLGGQHGFKATVVVIHPFQDLGGGFRASEAAVGRALPGSFACIATGEKFRNDHYYPYDGHLNASGHAHLAAILNAAIDNAPHTCTSAP